jgi:tetratricopeptide (TPR) repeat protein
VPHTLYAEGLRSISIIHLDNSAPSLQTAAALMRTGRLREAAQTYRQVLAVQPRHADAWYNLGYLLRQLGDFSSALNAYAQALAYGCSEPEQVHLNRAALFSDHLQRYPEAEHELKQALRLCPDYPPALLNLGNLHEERGEEEQAGSAYRRLLSSPSAAIGLRLQAQARLLQLEPPRTLDDPRLDDLHQACAKPDIDPDTRATGLFALAQAHDRLKNPEQAFSLAETGNRIAHAGAPGYHREETEARFRRIAEVFTGPSSPLGTQDSPSPLFICGMFRSGSTLLEQALACHPLVHAGGELDLLPRLIAGRLAPFPEAVRGLSEHAFAELAHAYRQHCARLFPQTAGYHYISDKRPDNFILIGLIKRMFPHARVVHTIRHPLDTGLSIFMHHLNPARFDYAGKLKDIGHHYGQYSQLMRHWHAQYPGSIHDFDYDAFVADPEPAMRTLLDFLELPWDPRCLQPHQAGNAVRTASYWQVRRPLHTQASGRWRRYRDQLAPLRQALAASGIELAD